MSSHPFGDPSAKLPPPTRYANIVRRKRAKPPRPIAVDEHSAASMLSISVRKLRRLASDPESLPSFKIGRTRMFRVIDLRRFLARQVNTNGGNGE